MDKPNESWERILEVIAATGHNPNSLARHIGLPHGENLYQIKRGNNRISLDVARRIHSKYPQYSIAWLISGGVNIALAKEQRNAVVRIPLYQDTWSDKFPPQEKPDEYLVLSASVAFDAELAVPYSDDLLNPFLRGAILLLHRHREQEVLLFGNIYLVDLQGMRLFRIIKRHEQNPEMLCLTTIQPYIFGDMVVSMEEISGLWRVVGAVCRLVR